MEKVYNEVSALLSKVLKTSLTAKWRSRYATTEQWAEEGPRYQEVAKNSWFKAKAIICEYRIDLDKYVKNPTIELEPQSVTTYNAACLAIDKEVDYMFEHILLEHKDE